LLVRLFVVLGLIWVVYYISYDIPQLEIRWRRPLLASALGPGMIPSQSILRRASHRSAGHGDLTIHTGDVNEIRVEVNKSDRRLMNRRARELMKEVRVVIEHSGGAYLIIRSKIEPVAMFFMDLSVEFAREVVSGTATALHGDIKFSGIVAFIHRHYGKMATSDSRRRFVCEFQLHKGDVPDLRAPGTCSITQAARLSFRCCW